MDQPAVQWHRPLIGSGGAPDSSYTPKEEPDNLQSRQRAYIKDIISAGPCRGPVNPGYQSIALDFTRVQNLDGTNNFGDMQDPAHPDDPDARIPSDMEFHIFTGTQDQLPVAGFDTEEATAAEGVRLRFGSGSAYTRTFSNPNLDAIRFAINVPALVKTKKNNDIDGAAVRIKFELNINGAGWVEVINDTINGKTTGGYTRSYEIALPHETKPGPWQVRITRLTKDSTTIKLRNDTVIESYTEVVDQKLSHPMVAYVASLFDATQFGSIPARQFEWYGRITDVPANYDPETRTYATTGPGTSGGIWDGTFKQAYHNNNSWVCWDILKDTENGLGQFTDQTRLDMAKWWFYDCAKVCDTMVSDGFGGTEPRYQFNGVVFGTEQALQVVYDFFGTMNATPAFVGGLIVPVQDKFVAPADYGSAYGPKNVENGDFVFSTTRGRARHNVALIEWNDMSDFARPKTEYVEDQTSILDDGGQNELHVTAVGCTSRGQAHRRGRSMILQEKLLTQAVQFRTGLQGASDRPGDVIPLSVPWRGHVDSKSGRIRSGTTGDVTLDRAVTLVSGHTYQLMFTTVDGKNVTAVISTGPGTFSNLFFSVALSSPPLADSLYIFIDSVVRPELFSIRKIKLLDNLKVEIGAIQYNPDIYDLVENNLVINPYTPPPAPDPSNQPRVGAIKFQQFAGASASDGIAPVFNKLLVSWGEPLNPDGSKYIFTKEYKVSYRHSTNNWKPLGSGSTREPNAELDLDTPGLYEVQVIAVNVLGGFSAPVTADYFMDDGNPLSPLGIAGLELVGQGHNTIFAQRDAKLGWRLASPSIATEIGMEGIEGIGGAQTDPMFKTFQVKIFNGVEEIWSEYLTDQQFTFTEEKNAEAMRAKYGTAANPVPNFTAEVVAIDVYNLHSAPAFISVSNPPTDPPADGSVLATLEGALVSCTPPKDQDLERIAVLMSTNPSDASPVQVGTISRGATTAALSGLNTTNDRLPRYFWLVAIDTFGNRSTAAYAGSCVPGYAAGKIKAFWVYYGGSIGWRRVADAGTNVYGGHLPYGVNTPVTVELEVANSEVYAQILGPGQPLSTVDFVNSYRHWTGSFPAVAGTGGWLTVDGGSVVGIEFAANYGGQWTDTASIYFDFDQPAAPPTTALPSFDLASGPYPDDGSNAFTVRTATPGSAIRYFTGPDAASTAAPSPTSGTVLSTVSDGSGTHGVIFLPLGHTHINVVAYTTGYTPSAVVGADYDVVPTGGGGGGGGTIAEPTFNPPGDFYDGNQTITIDCATPGVVMRWTKDGREPSNDPANLVGTVYDSSHKPVLGTPNRSRPFTLKVVASINGLPDARHSEDYQIDNTS